MMTLDFLLIAFVIYTIGAFVATVILTTANFLLRKLGVIR